MIGGEAAGDTPRPAFGLAMSTCANHGFENGDADVHATNSAAIPPLFQPEEEVDLGAEVRLGASVKVPPPSVLTNCPPRHVARGAAAKGTKSRSFAGPPGIPRPF